MEVSNTKVALDVGGGGLAFWTPNTNNQSQFSNRISKKWPMLEEFQTVVKEAENNLNSRPLTYQSDDSRDIPLTQSQLAWGRDITLMPPLLQPGDPLDPDYDAKETRLQYTTLSNALERFRKRWLSEYLLALREKHYNRCADDPHHHLRVGQLVTVKHDNLHRIEWPLGVITTVYPDETGVLKTAEVEECGRRSVHSATFLVPLELDCHWEEDVIRQSLRDRGGEEEEEEYPDNEFQEHLGKSKNEKKKVIPCWNVIPATGSSPGKKVERYKL